MPKRGLVGNAGGGMAARWLVVALCVLFPSCGTDDQSTWSGASEGGESAEPAQAGASGNSETAGGGESRPHSAGAPMGGASLAEGGTAAGRSGEGGAASAAGASAGEGGAAGEPPFVVPTGPCSGGPRCLNDQVAAACSEAGRLTVLKCTNGCVAGACVASDLSVGWLLHQFVLSDDTVIAASYSFSKNGASALQTQNSQPSIYYLDRDLESVEVRGSFAVETSSDDDMIGFVFGLQDSEHFYLFDWKQAAQDDGVCGSADVGAALKVVSASTELTLCREFWQSTDTAGVKVLVPPSANSTGWLDNTVYDFNLRHVPGHISITVKQGTTTVLSLTSDDATYSHGRFGFYNYSQESSRYEFFEFQPAP